MQCGATASSFIKISHSCLDTVPIPVAVGSQAQVSSRFGAGTAGSNPAEGKAVHLSCFVGSDFYDELITRSQESYRVCVCVCMCLIVCDLETSKRSGLGPLEYWSLTCGYSPSILACKAITFCHLGWPIRGMCVSSWMVMEMRSCGLSIRGVLISS